MVTKPCQMFVQQTSKVCVSLSNEYKFQVTICKCMKSTSTLVPPTTRDGDSITITDLYNLMYLRCVILVYFSHSVYIVVVVVVGLAVGPPFRSWAF